MSKLDFDTLPDLIVGERLGHTLSWIPFLGEEKTVTSVSYEVVPSNGLTIADLGVDVNNQKTSFAPTGTAPGDYNILVRAEISDLDIPIVKFKQHIEAKHER